MEVGVLSGGEENSAGGGDWRGQDGGGLLLTWRQASEASEARESLLYCLRLVSGFSFWDLLVSF